MSFEFFDMRGCKIKKSEYPFINHEEAAEFCQLKDKKCVEETYPKFREKIKKIQRKEGEKLNLKFKINPRIKNNQKSKN